MKYLIIIPLLLLYLPVASAQQVVASNGNSNSTTTVEVSWTIGESVIDTYVIDENILTQGFHQTRLTVTAISEILFPGLEINVFPNPTQDILTIQFNELIEGSSFRLYDLSGKLLENKLISSTATEISMKRYPSGQYILKLMDESMQTIQTFQIVKF